MSSPGPFGDGNPFGGFLGDIAKMLAGQGPLHWDAARQFAFAVATEGAAERNVDPLVRIRMQELARVAELQVERVTGLSVSTTGGLVQVLPLTTGQWVQRSLDELRPWFERLAAALAKPAAGGGAGDSGDGGIDAFGADADPSAAMLAGLFSMLQPAMLGMAAGSMVGHLAKRSFGQYDFPLPRPRSDEVAVVAANVASFAEDWSLPPDDVALWVCLSELTHHAVLGVTHVRERLDDLIGQFIDGFRANPHALEERFAQLDPDDTTSLEGLQRALGDPEVLLGAMQTPAQAAVVPALDALVAVIVGYVDHVMDEVGRSLLGSFGGLAEAMRRRRVEADQSDRFVGKLLGLTLTQAQVDRGEAFVRGVLERAGADGLARLWTSARELPTPSEVDAPGLWLARIDL